jgi:hypothetical protein
LGQLLIRTRSGKNLFEYVIPDWPLPSANLFKFTFIL